ncbi:WxL protein peptidoglycan domain-containing protein [Loigolactobacillus binensis]|uniref:WxL protein peptidoglycan domain-containing protein n=1 Tax=Loigolactobacillus binensis TaxID=2559922 RepID=A0ABW3EGD3_9LACO|nr:DUF916 domain-containing protein [Loigolactobacillus binensis]
MKKLNYWLLALAFLVLLLAGQPVIAASNNIAVVPQITGSHSERFQLIVKPGTTRKLQVTLTNFAATSQTIVLTPRNATTSAQGKIGFTRAGKLNEAPDFRQMVTPQRYKLAAHAKKLVTIRLQVPPQKFSGLLIGGLHFYSATDHAAVVDVPVWLTETNRSVPPRLALAGITARTYGGQPYLLINLENRSEALLKKVTVDLKITHAGLLGIGSTTNSFVQTYPSFAPYTQLPLVWGRAKNPVQSGRYQITGTITSQGKQWSIKQRTVLTRAAAKQANAKASNLVQDYTWLLLLVIGLLIVVNVLVIAKIIRKYKRR